MPEWASTTLIVVITLLIFFGMWVGWRGRVRRDAALVPVRDVPADAGDPVTVARVLYVATTRHDQPLERLAIRGLGFRAQGTLAAYRTGVAISLDGGADVWAQASVIIAAEPAQVAIDKVVEKGGLFKLSWQLSGETVDSYFRVFEPEKSGALYAAIDSITSAESEV